MRIGIVCYPTYGGSGVMATELGLGLAKRGHQVHFISYRSPARLPIFHENIFFHEASAMDYPLFEHIPYESALASKLVHVIEGEKLELLHVHYALPHASIAYITKQILNARGCKIPFITTLHGTDITLVGTSPDYAPIVEFGINVSDGVTAVSQSLKQQTLDSFHVTNDIKVIYNFVDFKRFNKTDKSHFKRAVAPNGEFLITHISNFRPVKRVSDIISTFHLVSKKLDAKLLLVGDGPDRMKIEQQAHNLGLASKIIFMGKQDAIEEILAISDIFILTSEHESFGLSALEAMACEVPVISTNKGGLPEVNIHGKSGYLSEVGDVKDMSQNIIRILTDDDLHIRLQKGAFEQAQKFNIDSIIQQYEDYYQLLLER